MYPCDVSFTPGSQGSLFPLCLSVDFFLSRQYIRCQSMKDSKCPKKCPMISKQMNQWHVPFCCIWLLGYQFLPKVLVKNVQTSKITLWQFMMSKIFGFVLSFLAHQSKWSDIARFNFHKKKKRGSKLTTIFSFRLWLIGISFFNVLKKLHQVATVGNPKHSQMSFMMTVGLILFYRNRRRDPEHQG